MRESILPLTWLSRYRSKLAFIMTLLTVAMLFFNAAHSLSPIEEAGESIAAQAGYTNQLVPLIIILLSGTLLAGMVLFLTARESIISLQFGMANRTQRQWPTKYHHFAIACMICVFVIATFPVWSNEEGYFGQRLTMMVAGLKPYQDFEYAYGYIVSYLPYLLHLTGLSIHFSLVITLCLFAVAGIISFAFIVERYITNQLYQVTLFWLLVICETFVNPGPSLNYNFGRYALPFVFISLLTESFQTFSIVLIFTIFAGAVVVLDFISPEIGLGFSFALLAWLAIIFRQASPGKWAAGFMGILITTVGIPLAVPNMFTTFNAYVHAPLLMPVVPNIIMMLAVFSFMMVSSVNFVAALSIWRKEQPPVQALQLSLPIAYVLLSTSLLPAMIGRSWPTITIAYGFVPIIMSIGYLSQSGSKWISGLVVCVFAAFIGYSAQFEIWHDVRAAGHFLKTTCANLYLQPRTKQRYVPSLPIHYLVEDTEKVAFLKKNYPGAYDPLAIFKTSKHNVLTHGYYLGLVDITTQQELDRKSAELERAIYYILPVRGNETAKRSFHRESELILSRFAKVGLYPYPLHITRPHTNVKDYFVDMLYQKCRQITTFDNFVICAKNDTRNEL